MLLPSLFQSTEAGDGAQAVVYSEFQEMIARLAVLMMNKEDTGVVSGDKVLPAGCEPVMTLRQLLQNFLNNVLLPRLQGDEKRFGSLLRQCTKDRLARPFVDSALNGRRKVC